MLATIRPTPLATNSQTMDGDLLTWLAQDRLVFLPFLMLARFPSGSSHRPAGDLVAWAQLTPDDLGAYR